MRPGLRPLLAAAGAAPGEPTDPQLDRTAGELFATHTTGRQPGFVLPQHSGS
ncbi:hypothetical protein [Actinacidiphila yanglinensis]|uniref:hypothetical protein n=1 Tax=Actinacidiphila yanglinensis TaxID=310779 RepID=UPI001359FCF7|nr:hypothetical protein [Actinacidiphila yanglinensis]